MRVLRIAVKHYRNLETAALCPGAGTNVIYGENAQGKTNLMEAVWLFTGGHSFRGARDGELVQFGQNGCELTLDFFAQEREQTATLTIIDGKRQAEINGVPQRSAAALVGRFCAVIFSPEHLALVKGGPALRRSFLDGALCQSRPTYAKQFMLYQRTLRQRNTLLKEILRRADLRSTLDIWDEKLAHYGTQLIHQREHYLAILSESVKDIYRGISQGRETLGIAYKSSLRRAGTDALNEQDFFRALYAARQSDLAMGCTGVGPHRDDMELTVDGVSARAFGSQGQQRSIVLAMKLAEAQALETLTGETPVILLDDVLSELDAGRQDYLLHHVAGRQVFLTCCDPHILRDFRGETLFEVQAGRVLSPLVPE